MQTFLAQENAGLAEAEWKVTCLLFAPNAPEQNPIEDLWLKGKTICANSLPSIKRSPRSTLLLDLLRSLSFDSIKCRWYWPDPQMVLLAAVCFAAFDHGVAIARGTPDRNECHATLLAD